MLFVKLWAAEGDITEKPIDPVKVYSDKELIREIEKIASTLVPEKDWSIRITAMQRVEGLVLGGWWCYIPLRTVFRNIHAYSAILRAYSYFESKRERIFAVVEYIFNWRMFVVIFYEYGVGHYLLMLIQHTSHS